MTQAADPVPFDTVVEGEHYYAAALLKDKAGTTLVKADVSTHRTRIYSLDSASPETVLYDSTALANTTTNADGSAQLYTAAQNTGYQPNSEGYTWLREFDLSTLLTTGYVGTRRYKIRTTFALTSSRGDETREWNLLVAPSDAG